MTHVDVPAWLQSALVAHPPSPSASLSTDIEDLGPGDLWVFERPNPSVSEPIRRVALILDVDDLRAHVALISNETEFASDNDVNLSSGDAHAPYATMAETAFHARVWLRYAKERVGFIEDDLLHPILDVLWGEPAGDLDGRRGHAYRQSTERDNFERDEFSDLRRLAEGCDPKFGATDPVPTIVDVAAVADRAVDVQSLVQIYEAFEERLVVVCHGLLPTTRHLQDHIVTAIGPDLVDTILDRVGALLLSGRPAQVPVELNGTWRQVLCSAPLSTDLPALRFHGGGDPGQVLAWIGGVPVISAAGASFD
jgi:hypothetical protein